MSRNKTVIYTAIFGGKDNLLEPRVVPPGCDFVCFTDGDFSSDVWEVRRVTPSFEDPTRNARMYKILPHRYLGCYETSVWIDGNLIVRGDVNAALERYLSEHNMAVFDHMASEWEPCNCIYDEAEMLVDINKRGRFKDDPKLIREQVETYRRAGFPAHKGLALTMTLLRRHNEPDVKEAMELWWSELKKHSKRDQLSFPYAIWKTGLKVTWIEKNARDNEWFKHTYHPEHQKTLLQRAWRRVKKIVT